MIFLKLGGSLITDKEVERSARIPTIERLAEEIAAYFESSDAQPLLVGHGSGSFGHQAAARHNTQQGVQSPEGWRGFSEVWQAAAELNQRVTQAIRAAGLPAISLPPSASALCQDGQIVHLAVDPVRHALEAGLLPIVYGDVAFDLNQGAAIMSTEAIFAFLASRLKPNRLLLAGLEQGVFADYPVRSKLLKRLGSEDLNAVELAGSSQTDVTGGMLDKVKRALALKEAQPDMEIRIFSGEDPGNIYQALIGKSIGTSLK